MKKFGEIVVLIVIIALCGVCFISCNSSSDALGKYYEENSDGTLDEASWIELKSGDKWGDSDGGSGTYEIDGTEIKFFIDGEEWTSN